MANIWDEELKDEKQDVKEYPTLPAGEYEFEVVKATGKEYSPKPGSKIGKCAEIDLQLRVEGNGTEVTVFERLYSDPKTVWKMTAFAKCIGIFASGMTPGQVLRNCEGKVGKAAFLYRAAAGSYPARNEVKNYIVPEVMEEVLPF